MLKTLIRVRLRGLLDSMLNRRRGKAGTDGKKKLLLLAIVAIYCIAVFGFLFTIIVFVLAAIHLRKASRANELLNAEEPPFTSF